MATESDAQIKTEVPNAETDAPPEKKQRRDNRFCEQDDIVELKEKVFIPVDKFPEHNFVGSILGPSGSILKELTRATKSKIAILGKGSMKDKEKEDELLKSEEEEEHTHLKEPLHVLIYIKAPRGDAHLRMHIALMEIYQFMTPPDKKEEFDQGPYGFGGGFGGPPRGRGGPRGGSRGRGGRGARGGYGFY